MDDIDFNSEHSVEFLAHAFPFHLRLGRDGRIESLGPLLQRLAPKAAVGLRATDLFCGESPTPYDLAFDELLVRERATWITQPPHPSLRLSGPIVVLARSSSLLFLGHPPVRQATDIVALRDRIASRPIPPPVPVPPPEVTPPRLRVLVADDSPVNLLLVQRLLESRGYQVLAVPDGAAAIELWQRETPDLILMDVHMPNLSGHEATVRIRELERASGTHTPIVALTASAFPQDRDACLQSGMDGYLTKPLRQEELFVILDGLKRRRADAPTPSPQAEATSSSSTPAALGRATPLLNREAALQTASGDAELLASLAKLFREQAPVILRAIESAIENRDATALAFHAHQLKGSLSILAVPSLEAAARGLESQGRAGRWERVPIWWAELRQGTAQLDEELETLCRSFHG